MQTQLLTQFLQQIVTTSNGYFCLALRSSTGEWAQQWFTWPDEASLIEQCAYDNMAAYDVYGSPHLFGAQKRTKDQVLSSATLFVDLDNADIAYLPFTPTVLVQTSIDRHQGYWILSHELQPDELEAVSKRLTYSILDADRSGWSIGHMVRVPGTMNHKYANPQLVQLLNSNGRSYEVHELATLPGVPNQIHVADTEFLTKPLNGSINASIGPNELLETFRPSIPAKVYALYNIQAPDRSRVLWALECALFRAGATREQVYYLASKSANNKFQDLKYNSERELAKDVMRAQTASQTFSLDAKELITSLRKAEGTVHERSEAISLACIKLMQMDGDLAHATNDSLWYISGDDTIQITAHNEALTNLLTRSYGINAAEKEFNYTVNSLTAKVASLPRNMHVSVLSRYMPATNSVLLHTYGKHVLHITADSITQVANGSYNIIFEHNLQFDRYEPNLEVTQSMRDNWASLLFGRLNNLTELSADEYIAIMRTWLLFLLLRDGIAESWPILAFLGQPGSAKTVTCKRIYKLLFGEQRKLSGISSAQNFDTEVSNYPLVVFDNVDTYQSWLMDRIAQAAGESNLYKRKLFTDNTSYIVERRAFIILTAHNPQFIREDTADRLLIINLERLPRKTPEKALLFNINAQRNDIWGAIVLDLQQVLRTVRPILHDTELRSADFMYIGEWISNALDYREIFDKAIFKMYRSQKSIVLNEDQILVDTIVNYARHSASPDSFKGGGQLWTEFSAYASDPTNFVRIYKNSTYLGKKLWAMQDALSVVVNMDWELSDSGQRLWRLTKHV